MSESPSTQSTLARVGPIGGFLFVVGIAVWLVGYLGGVGSQVAMQSYTFAFIFWSFLSLGCMGLLLFHHAVRPSWGTAVMRLLEAGASPANFLVIGLMFLPIAYTVIMPGEHTVYTWALAENAHDPVLVKKAFWLNGPFWVIRGFVYVIFWAALSGFLRNSSLKQDQNLDPNEAIKRSNVAAPMMVLFTVMATLATVDWVMSLAWHWFSTILGLLFLVGSALTAMSLANFIVAKFSKQEPYVRIVTPHLNKDLGNMMFALTLLWTYMTLSQFLITWSGNLPEETPYYLRRASDQWVFLSTILVVGQFFLPFLMLLAPRMKKYAKNIMRVAIVICSMRLVDVYWSTIPDMRNGMDVLPSLAIWTDYAAFLALGGLWLAIWGSQIKRGSLLPAHDRRLEEAALAPQHA